MSQQILITLTADDVTMMQSIESFIRQHNRTPKKREVSGCLERDFKGTRGGRVFERLKLLGIVQHQANGHCALTQVGMDALNAKRGSQDA